MLSPTNGLLLLLLLPLLLLLLLTLLHPTLVASFIRSATPVLVSRLGLVDYNIVCLTAAVQLFSRLDEPTTFRATRGLPLVFASRPLSASTCFLRRNFRERAGRIKRGRHIRAVAKKVTTTTAEPGFGTNRPTSQQSGLQPLVRAVEHSAETTSTRVVRGKGDSF